MNTFFMSLLMVPPSQDQGNPFGVLFPIILMVGIFYFLIIRPQSKKQKETQKMISALKKGDRIVTIGGIHGTIQTVKEQSVIVKVDENTKIEFNRGAISSIVTAAVEEKSETEDKTVTSEQDEASSVKAIDSAQEAQPKRKIPWSLVAIAVVTIILLLVMWLPRNEDTNIDEPTGLEMGTSEQVEMPTEPNFDSDEGLPDDSESTDD